MTRVVLHVDNIGKSFREYGTEWRRFGSWFGWKSAKIQENWVLRNISFVVRKGEAVGIVGQNGAGKSTLLKLITGTLGATEGMVRTGGRIAAILELGMGFDPDLTGRQNVAHSAGLMGFSRAEIQKLVPEMEAFAEIGAYFDEPMRTYSSGMQMRVAFSLATAARPEILIVDEALAVGDAYFVHKCFKRIREFREAGTTLLIVSHDKSAVQTLCDRAVMIDRGRLVADGTPQEVLDLYNAMIAEKENSTVQQMQVNDGSSATISGTGEATVDRVWLEDRFGNAVEFVGVGDLTDLVIRVRVKTHVDRLVIGYMLRDRLGQALFGTNTFYSEQVIEEASEGDVFELRASFPMNLGAGSYSVSVALSSTETHLVNNYEWRDLALVFTVANTQRAQFVGMLWLPPRLTLTSDGRQMGRNRDTGLNAASESPAMGA
jgi:lipopolysaccharide transport system ATP-binding protein